MLCSADERRSPDSSFTARDTAYVAELELQLLLFEWDFFFYKIGQKYNKVYKVYISKNQGLRDLLFIII